MYRYAPENAKQNKYRTEQTQAFRYMANILIASYYSRWDLSEHEGRIAFYDPDNQLIENRLFSDPAEFQVIISMLRHDTPLWYDTEACHLRAGTEPAGEGEE